MKILSVEQCDKITENLKNFDSAIVDYCTNIEAAIKVFNNDPTVQSFYASGGFGKGMEAKLEEVRIAVKKYYDVISSDGGLIPVTKIIVADQRDLLSKQSNGGV